MYKKNIILTALFLFNINNVFAYNKHDRNEFLEQKILVVPSGMRTSTPIISDETFARIAKKNNLSDKSFGEDDLKKLDTKFTTIVGKLKKQHVFDKIGETAKKYGVKPETVAACIIGEHVFNVNLADNFQNYFINVYSKWILKHDPAHDIYLKFIEEPEIAAIIKSSDINDYEKWNSIFELYTKKI